MKQFMVATDLAKLFGDDLVFEGASFNIHAGQKVALVGPNGSGKSTLLKIIAGLDIPDEGSINTTSGTTMGYASQHVSFQKNQTISEVMYEVIADKLAVLDRIKAVEVGFATTEFGSAAFDKLSRQYETLQQQAELEGTHQLETKIKVLLTRFGFDDTMWSRDVMELSGGQQIRLHLAKLLLQEPDILLLDEPTNHLDIETIIWLENYLQGYKKAIIYVSHDQQLLRSLSTNVWQIISGEFITFKGKYDDYKAYISEHIGYLERQQQALLVEKARMSDFIDRNLTRASTTGRAQSVRKRLNKMEDVKLLKIPTSLRPFSLPVTRQSGKFIYKLHELVVGYTKPLFGSITLDIERFERIALVGKNGIGKSTLLSTLYGNLSPISGDFEVGHHVDASYFLQQQVFTKNNISVYDTFSEVYPDANKATIYPILARFGFSQEEVHLNNATLSGGEKQRLLLSLLYFQKSNTLLLDEPTNHLDIESKEALTESLQKFDGTIIFASHDRTFIEELATKIIFIHDAAIYYFDTYAEFQTFSSAEVISESNDNQNKATTASQLDRAEQKQLEAEVRRVDRKIAEIEEEIETIESAIADANALLALEENYSDFTKAQELAESVEKHNARLDVLMGNWEIQHEKLAALTNE